MNLGSLLFTVIAAAALSSAGAATIDHDKVQPFPQPEPVTVSEKAAVKFKPSVKIEYVCHPYPAVNAAGETSGGLKGTGSSDGDCKGSALGSQVYGRAGWHKDLWAIMYAWYFPKNMYYTPFGQKGHRHKWVSAVVWLDNPALEKPKILAVSTSEGDGVYDIVKNGPPSCDGWLCPPSFKDCVNGTTPMLRVGQAQSNLVSMSKAKTGELQNLIMWEQLTQEGRDALSKTGFGGNITVPFIDANFKVNIEAARPFL